MITVDVPADAALDTGSKGTLAAPQLTITSDITGPTPVITGPASPTSLDPFAAMIDFGETVTGFAIGDITVTNGVATGLVDLGNGLYES